MSSAEERIEFSYQQLLFKVGEAVGMDRKWKQGQLETINEAMGKLSRKATKRERENEEIAARIRWAKHALAQDMRDDTLLAQRMGNLHGQLLIVELLLDIRDLLQQLVDGEEGEGQDEA